MPNPKLPECDLRVAEVWQAITSCESSRALRRRILDDPSTWRGEVPHSEVFRRWWYGHNLPDIANFLNLVRVLGLDHETFGEAILAAREAKGSLDVPRGRDVLVMQAIRDGRPLTEASVFSDEAPEVLRKLEARGWVGGWAVPGSAWLTPAGVEALALREES